MKTRSNIISLVVLCSLPGVAGAATVGDIQAVYYAPNSFGLSSSLDAPAFVFENTSSQDITNAVFSIGPGGVSSSDSFAVGTIHAGGSFILVPGLANDGGTGHTFFNYTGSALDTSDGGPDGNNVQFDFTGTWNSVAVSSNVFTPLATYGPANDNAATVNFLGLNDGPSYNIFGPKVVANITTTSTPEPTTLALLAVGGLGLLVRRRRSA